VPFYLFLLSTTHNLWTAYVSVGYITAAICAFFKRGRLAVNDWKNQKLAYFTGVLPEQPMEAADSQTGWMDVMKSIAVIAACVFLALQFYSTLGI
jgi:hypothetical protein